MQETNWRAVDTRYADGPTNMAVDEAILLACARGEVPPTLRLYGWERPCLSIGYFQRATQEVNLEECEKLGIPCVRRLTGGRAVLHDRELTYSVVMPASHPLAAGGIVRSYRSISAGLVAGLMALGVAVETAPPGRHRRAGADEFGSATDERFRTPACFDATSDFELTVRGRKLVGSAQTRKRGAVLQHGTILLDFDAANLIALLWPAPTTSNRFAEELRSKVISLREALGREVGYEEVASSIKGGFERALGISFSTGVLTPSEIAAAAELRKAKYRSTSWNLRR